MPKKAKNPTPSQKKRIPLTDDEWETLGPLEEPEMHPVGLTADESWAWTLERLAQAKAWQAHATPAQLAQIASFRDKMNSCHIGPVTGPGGTPLDGTPGQAEPAVPPRS